MTPLVPIVVDRREQRPYLFNADLASVSRGTLASGDYSLIGREASIAIERKSLEDFISTVIHSRERFREELRRLASYEFAVVVIEANASDLIEHAYSSSARAQSVIGLWASIVTDYRIPAYFLGDRQTAQHFTERMLVRLWRASETVQVPA